MLRTLPSAPASPSNEIDRSGGKNDVRDDRHHRDIHGHPDRGGGADHRRRSGVEVTGTADAIVDQTGAPTITNSGTVSNDSGDAIFLSDGGTITNVTGASITAPLVIEDGDVSIDNAGFIQTATLTGSDTAANTASILNSGTIEELTFSGMSDVSLQNQGAIGLTGFVYGSLTNAGTIGGLTVGGLTVGDLNETNFRTIDNSGVIADDFNSGFALYASSGGTINNTGTVIEQGPVQDAIDQNGPTSIGTLQVNNSGVIEATLFAIQSSTTTDITNSGTIASAICSAATSSTPARWQEFAKTSSRNPSMSPTRARSAMSASMGKPSSMTARSECPVRSLRSSTTSGVARRHPVSLLFPLTAAAMRWSWCRAA